MRTTHAPRRITSLAGALLAALALAGCGDGDTGSSDTATPAHDTSAQHAAADWLAGQLTDGVMHDEKYGFDDFGLSADTALGLAAVDEKGYGDTITQVADQLEAHLKDYVSPGYGTVASAGGTAKALLLAVEADRDPTSFGGTDLVAQLERLTVDEAPAAGRIRDEIDPRQKDAADYANTVAQAYAVRALAAVKSNEAAAAADFLLAQQCDEGWFRVVFTADPAAVDQSCDGDPASKPDVDATAFAIEALQDVDDDAAEAAVSKAVTWLVSQQAADGSFATGEPAATNANSTGLAGIALADGGESEAAERAAKWVAAHQLGWGVCATSDAGAVAYDDAAAKVGVTKETAGQFRLATVQSLDVLGWLPTGTAKAGC